MKSVLHTKSPYEEPAVCVVWLNSEQCFCASDSFGTNDIGYDNYYDNAFGDEN